MLAGFGVGQCCLQAQGLLEDNVGHAPVVPGPAGLVQGGISALPLTEDAVQFSEGRSERTRRFGVGSDRSLVGFLGPCEAGSKVVEAGQVLDGNGGIVGSTLLLSHRLSENVLGVGDPGLLFVDRSSMLFHRVCGCSLELVFHVKGLEDLALPGRLEGRYSSRTRRGIGGDDCDDRV